MRAGDMDRAWSQQSVDAYWDGSASTYLLRFRDELREKPFDIALLDGFADGLGSGASVCDIGCGPCGHIARFLADRGLTVVGVDSSPVCVGRAQQAEPALDFRIMDARELEFIDASFDGIVAFYLLHYLPRSLWPNVLAEFRRVLKPNGQMLLVLKAGDSESWIDDPLGTQWQTYWSAMPSATVAEIVSAAGFEVTADHVRKASTQEIAVDRIYIEALRPRDISMPTSLSGDNRRQRRN